MEVQDQVGRILVATRDIEPGEIIFKEKEMVVGPCRASKPVCLGNIVRTEGVVL